MPYKNKRQEYYAERLRRDAFAERKRLCYANGSVDEVKCFKCEKVKSITEYGKSNRGVCKSCRTLGLKNKWAIRKMKNYKSIIKEREQNRIRRSKRKSAGLCTNCNNKKLADSLSCLSCWFGDLSKRYLGTGKRKCELIEIYTKQKFLCVYTGEKLIPGKNMSLDHILPLSRYPHLGGKVENLQFTTHNANRIKSDMTDDEFIAFCKGVVETRDISKTYSLERSLRK